MDQKLIERYKDLLPTNFEWNDGYYLEGIDRVHTIQVLISEILDQHPAIVLSHHQEDIDIIQDMFSKIYQDIGAMEYEKSK